MLRRVGRRLPLHLAPGADRISVPVTLSPQRCDPHAIAEDYRRVVFAVRLSLDGGAPASTTVAVTDPASRRLLDAYLVRTCTAG